MLFLARLVIIAAEAFILITMILKLVNRLMSFAKDGVLALWGKFRPVTMVAPQHAYPEFYSSYPITQSEMMV